MATTASLSPEEAVLLVRDVCSGVRGGGKSLLTTGLRNLGSTVDTSGGTETAFVGAIVTGGLVKGTRLCTFPVRASASGGVTTLRIGGLASYQTSQTKLYYLIPMSPKQIPGFDAYRRVLDAVAAEVRAIDGGATTAIKEI